MWSKLKETLKNYKPIVKVPVESDIIFSYNVEGNDKKNLYNAYNNQSYKNENFYENNIIHHK